MVKKCEWNRKFLYTLKHSNRKTGTTTTTYDLNYAGYLDAIYEKLRSVNTAVEHYGTDDGGVTRYCIVSATAIVEDPDGNTRTFTAYGEAHTANGDPVGKLASFAETRAKKRCFATALNLTHYDFNDPENVVEEEPGTRVVDEIDITPTSARDAKLHALADRFRQQQSQPRPKVIDSDEKETTVGEW